MAIPTRSSPEFQGTADSDNLFLTTSHPGAAKKTLLCQVHQAMRTASIHRATLAVHPFVAAILCGGRDAAIADVRSAISKMSDPHHVIQCQPQARQARTQITYCEWAQWFWWASHE